MHQASEGAGQDGRQGEAGDDGGRQGEVGDDGGREFWERLQDQHSSGQLSKEQFTDQLSAYMQQRRRRNRSTEVRTDTIDPRRLEVTQQIHGG